jgi:hypothetical protein
MKPHKHSELIKAWADGAEIQALSKITENKWIDCTNDVKWFDEYEYRIKPEPKPDVVKLFKAEAHPILGIRFTECTDLPRNDGEHWIKTVWDAEKPELKSAEVLK